MFSSQNSQVSNAANYIEDVFSTYLYTGNGSTQTIINGIDLAGKGGMTWIKQRNQATSHRLFDTARGVQNSLASNSTAGTASFSGYLTAFNSNGFSVGSANDVNESGFPLVSWTFRKQPKFFDVVTYTGNGVTGNEVRSIPHNLGSTPGCVIVKRTDSAWNWFVQHQALGPTKTLFLNTTAATRTDPGDWGDTSPTSTDFYVSGNINVNGGQYVAYIFAHDAGGFGLTGTDNVISCGSFTTDSIGKATVTLGYEPQFAIIKGSSAVTNWYTTDTMRGWTNRGDTTGSATILQPNTSDAEYANNLICYPTATGFFANMAGDTTYIYIAIRRGPMKVPTSGTSVFSAQLTAAAPVTLTGLLAPDAIITRIRGSSSDNWNSAFMDRLRGNDARLVSSSTAAEASTFDAIKFTSSQNAIVSVTSNSMVDYSFLRAPSFFDEVCYTGTGSATTFSHNLGVAPEMMIVKKRNASTGINWSCYHVALGNTQVISLNEDIQAYTSTQWNNTTPTASVFSVGTQSNVNASGSTYVAYLFASCNGVSKVGSYTGTGTTQQINCGFTGGARFILIKRTDEVASGNPWYVWDSARGIVAGNDPYLLLSSTAAEVTSTDYVDTYSAGFEISSTAPAAINASGGTFIFLAIA